MPKNAFTKFKTFVSPPKRNVFDLSFQNNMTGKFGALYPVFCKEVIPGDSFRITPTMAFRMMPMYFPVQTKIRADLHFFYVRNRNLWEDWSDFICQNKSDLVPPYIFGNPSDASEYQEMYGTGSLFDYLGVPTTFGGSYGSSGTYTPYGVNGSFASDGTYPYSFLYGHGSSIVYPFDGDVLQDTFVGKALSSCITSTTNTGTYVGFLFGVGPIGGSDSSSVTNTLFHYELGSTSIKVYVNAFPSSVSYDQAAVIAYNPFTSSATIIGACYATLTQDDNDDDTGTYSYQLTIDDTELSYFNSGVAEYLTQGYSIAIAFQRNAGINQYVVGNSSAYYPTSVSVEAASSYVAEAGSTVSSRFINRNGYLNGISLSALPFRAYESIYNAFYRNQQNDPFTVDGVAEYNKWLSNTAGGPDTTTYELRYRNWESDFLTTAVQSPQQGTAPLVGVSASGTFTFQDSDGNEYTAKAVVGDDGLLTGIETYDNDLPVGSLRRLVDAISHGVSINDFRNVNALQRWLETNIRRGYKYKDQILSHFGVDARFEELDMPEFIGGMSEVVNVSTTYQTVESSENPLGSYAGNGTLFGSSRHSVEKYCDEHGFIIGILSFVPTPVYSQLMPKFLMKDSPLDYFFPEFGHIGLQPITYGEVCPVQKFAATYEENDGSFTSDWASEVFGYQRAWYDYLGSVDEVHGEFRTTLRDFLCNRTFDSAPELGADFLHIDPDQLNNIFSVTTNDDKFLGLLNFEVTAKRPIPKYGVPRLE